MWTFFSKEYRRRQWIEQPLADEWRKTLSRNVAIYERLTAAERERLDTAIKIIVAERSFVGLRGFVITDEVKVIIAAQAALLLLGNDGYYFHRVQRIFVEPTHHKSRTKHLLNDSIFGEPVVLVEEHLAEGAFIDLREIRLAWDDVLVGASNPFDGENVVLHEFAHHVDGLDGVLDGVPPLPDVETRVNWSTVFKRELAKLRSDLKRRQDTFLHDAAADGPEELFAYSTECFFEQPLELAELHPDLFDCLRGFYKIDPRLWANTNPD
jgi:Mlc titration factor MtfA (ptsG expression regulator)